MNFVELVAYNRYGATDVAFACLEPGREVDLARYFHTRFSLIGELLELCGEWRTTSQLLTAARSAYGFTGDIGDIRTRIALLADAGLLQRFDKMKARISPLGADFLQSIELQKKRHPSPMGATTDDESADAESSITPEQASAEQEAVQDILKRLRKCAVTGSMSTEFEVAVSDAFGLLGFQTRLISGSSDTDVLAVAELPESDRYSVVIEAKSTSASSVPESQVNFEGIKRHRKKNGADFAALIGVKFPKSTLESAQANDVAVITTEDLTSLIESHQRSPLSIMELKEAFASTHNNLEALDPSFSKLDNSLSLAAAIMRVLVAESIENDPEDRGYVSLESLRWALRTVGLNFRPSKDEIRESLTLLTHSLIGAVQRGSEGKYALADTPEVASRRIVELGQRMRESWEENEDN